jgi:hypothetical protein
MTAVRTGRPCAHCGETTRYVSNGRCVACNNERYREWYAKNPEKERERKRKWRAAMSQVERTKFDLFCNLRKRIRQLERRIKEAS